MVQKFSWPGQDSHGLDVFLTHSHVAWTYFSPGLDKFTGVKYNLTTTIHGLLIDILKPEKYDQSLIPTSGHKFNVKFQMQ